MKDLTKYPKGCFNYADGSVHHSNVRATLYMIHFDERGMPFESDAYAAYATQQQIENYRAYRCGKMFAIKDVTFASSRQLMMPMSKRRWDRLYIYAKDPDKDKSRYEDD